MKNISILFIISCFTFQLSIAQYEGYSADSWKDQLEIEEIFAKQIDKTSFKKHLKKLTERPHVVGSAANDFSRICSTKLSTTDRATSDSSNAWRISAQVASTSALLILPRERSDEKALLNLEVSDSNIRR